MKRIKSANKVAGLIAAAALTLTLSAAALAQSQAGGQGGGQFEQRKAAILQRLSDTAAKIQEKQACVQAAGDGAALKACLPNLGKRRGGGNSGAGGDDGGGEDSGGSDQ